MSARYSAAAERDLATIYLESDAIFGRRQAEAYSAGLGATIRMITEYPLASRLRDDTQPPVRVRPYKAHIIVYAADESGVLILRIRHSHEDWLSDPLGEGELTPGDPS